MLEFIKNFQSNDSLELPKEYNNKIDMTFLELLKKNEDALSKKQYMDLFYFFDRLERFITLLRNEERNMANSYFDKFNPLNFEYPVSFKPYVQSLYLYATAYKHFSEGANEDAYKALQQAFSLISPNEKGASPNTLSRVELTVRAFPILLKNESKNKIIERVSAIISDLLLNGKNSNTGNDMELLNLPEEKKRAWLFYILDSVMYNVNMAFRNDGNQLKLFYRDLFASILQKIKEIPDTNIEIYYGMTILAKTSIENMSEIDKDMNKHFLSIKKCPSLMKQLLLKYYAEYLKSISTNVSSHKNYDNFLESIKPYQVSVA